MPKVVKCNKCGLCFPEDYFTEWGRKYGRGLGTDPVCEGLSSMYHRPMFPKGRVPESKAQLMHPLEVCRGSLTSVEVSATELKENTPILAATDKGMRKRAEIMRKIQIGKSASLKAAIERFDEEENEAA